MDALSSERFLDMHHVSVCCADERCRCGLPATHKVSEKIFDDDPHQRHPFTAYVCCGCFRSIMGDSVFCPDGDSGDQPCQNDEGVR